jgi:hypothetical protein
MELGTEMDRHRTELVQHSTYRGSSHWQIGANRVQIKKEVISDLKRENQFLSKETWESILLISREMYVKRF